MTHTMTRANNPPLFTAHYTTSRNHRACFVLCSRRYHILLEVLLGVGEAALDEGKLSLANATLLAEADLAIGGLVTVKMLLAGAPAEHLGDIQEASGR